MEIQRADIDLSLVAALGDCTASQARALGESLCRLPQSWKPEEEITEARLGAGLVRPRSGSDRQGFGFQARQIDNLACVVDIDPDKNSFAVEVEVDSRRNLSNLRTRPLGEVDVERISLGVIVQPHQFSSPKRLSKKAL